MPAYKNEKTGKWDVRISYRTIEGNKKEHRKRGFIKKKEALQYEKDFKDNLNPNLEMSFKTFYDIYMKDVSATLRPSVIQSKGYKIKRILPTFGEMSVNSITANDVKNWQNELIKEDFSEKYIKNLKAELSAVLNHAVTYYGLQENPCTKVKPAKKPNDIPSKMGFWTYDEFKQVYDNIEDLKCSTAVLLLYWTGMRKGELYALTWDKIDFDKKSVLIDRSLQRINGKNHISQTKTYESREILLPDVVIEKLQGYKNHQYKVLKTDYVFEWEKTFIQNGLYKALDVTNKQIEEYNKSHDLKKDYIHRIRLHDLRHSHASYLVNENVNITLISKRLGHKNPSMTLNTYSHFYPNNEKTFIDSINKMK